MLFLSTVPWLKDHSHNSKIQHKIHRIYEVKPYNKLPLIMPLYIIPPSKPVSINMIARFKMFFFFFWL